MAFRSKFSNNIFPIWYNPESVQVKLMMNGNSVVFVDIKISFGLFISAPKNQAERISIEIHT